MNQRLFLRAGLPLLIVLAALLAFHLTTLQTIPNGSEHYYMIDVGETQIVLNVFGTLHATGYPLYVMTGGALTALLRALGAAPAAAPGLVSLLWGILALALMGALSFKLTERGGFAAAVVLIYGLTRTVWIHNSIAEIYSFTLLFTAALYALAVWWPPERAPAWRLAALALVGGAGVAHHRALAMLIPALVLAVWPEVWALRRKPLALVGLLALGLLGFLPYAYLPLRAQAGAAWVYGEPGTWAGLWDQFIGREAERFMGVPSTLEGIAANFALITRVILDEVSLAGMVIGLAGLIAALRVPSLRQAALAFLIGGLAAYLFHGLFYSDILSALILLVTLSFAFGWLFAAVLLADAARRKRGFYRLAFAGLLVAAAAAPTLLYAHNAPFIRTLVTDPTGLETIALMRRTPPNATLMLAWGPRHFAVGFARDVLGERQDIRLVDHKADYRAALESGLLITPAYTFYAQPIPWWEERIGAPVVLRAAAPGLVQIDTRREMGAAGDAPTPQSYTATCTEDQYVLDVRWGAARAPQRDLSVFVHLLDAAGNILAQADQSAPVYGWRPLTSWQAGEIVRDIYALPRDENAAAIRFGLYEQLPDGAFQNTVSIEMPVPVECDDEP